MQNNRIQQKTLLNPPIFINTWLTYIGCVTGVLRAFGKNVDVVDVGGYSGYVFLNNATKGWIDPGSPTLHNGNVLETNPDVIALWKEMDAGIAPLGAELERVWDPKHYREGGMPLTTEERNRAMAQFAQVKASLDDERPVMIWGMVFPEYGLAAGYTEDKYLVSTFRPYLDQQDDPIHFADLDAKGGLDAVYFHPTRRAPTSADDRAALRRALDLARIDRGITFDTPTHSVPTQRYVNGLDAYEVWADTIANATPQTASYEYLSYVIACVHEAKGLAADFLLKLAQRYPNTRQGGFLAKASDEYRLVAREFGELTAMFPPGTVALPPQHFLQRAADTLRGMKAMEQSATDLVDIAVSIWE